MREKETSLDAILGAFHTTDSEIENGSKTGTTLTIWVPVDTKVRYDRIQQKSGRRFSSKLRELIEAAIQIAESRAS